MSISLPSSVFFSSSSFFYASMIEKTLKNFVKIHLSSDIASFEIIDNSECVLKNINEDKPSSYRKTISILSHCSIHPFCLPYPSSYLAIKSATVNKRGVRGQRSELRGGVTGNRVFQLTTSDSFQFLSLSLSLSVSRSLSDLPLRIRRAAGYFSNDNGANRGDPRQKQGNESRSKSWAIVR